MSYLFIVGTLPVRASPLGVFGPRSLPPYFQTWTRPGPVGRVNSVSSMPTLRSRHSIGSQVPGWRCSARLPVTGDGLAGRVGRLAAQVPRGATPLTESRGPACRGDRPARWGAQYRSWCCVPRSRAHTYGFARGSHARSLAIGHGAGAGLLGQRLTLHLFQSSSEWPPP